MVITKLDVIEWIGVITAMIASALVATHTFVGVGYIFYTLSSLAVGYVMLNLKRKGLLYLQGYFIVINLIGIYNYLLN